MIVGSNYIIKVEILTSSFCIITFPCSMSYSSCQLIVTSGSIGTLSQNCFPVGTRSFVSRRVGCIDGVVMTYSSVMRFPHFHHSHSIIGFVDNKIILDTTYDGVVHKLMDNNVSMRILFCYGNGKNLFKIIENPSLYEEWSASTIFRFHRTFFRVSLLCYLFYSVFLIMCWFSHCVFNQLFKSFSNKN